MHLKKTKKTPRMFRMIALMLSLVLVFFTMTGMALAEEGTDVSDAAPDSTLEIVETELEVEPEPTEEPPAETPGAEETPEPTPESEDPSIPPEPTDTPALEPDYELDAEIPTGWHNAPVTITVRLIDKNNTGWVKIEAAFSNEDDAERFDVTEEWNEYGYLERTMPDNGTVYFYITDPMGVEHELPLDVFCMDFEAPTLRAGINGTLLHVEANDALSGIAAVFVNDELYTTLEDGELNVRIDNLRDDAYLYIDALDNAGNWTDYVVLANPFYEEEPEPTPTPTPDTGDDEHDEHCPTDCDCRKNNTSGSSSGSSFGGSSGGASSVSGGSKNAGSSAQTPASSEAPAPTTEPITKEDGTGFTQNGNSVTRDLLYDKYSNKQFITIETRNGETFYLVIDYDKLLFAGSAAITAFLTVEVVINISPISIHRFTAAFADKHTAAFCTAYRAVVLLLPAAANAASHGANRHLAIVGLPFQQRHNCISILIVGIMVAVRRRFAVRFGIFSTLK